MGSFLRIGSGSFCHFEQRDFFGARRLRGAFRPELSEFRCAAMQDAVRLGACAVDGELDSFDGFVSRFHRVVDDVITDEQRAELGFDAGTAPQPPDGPVDFIDQSFFENVRWSKAATEFSTEFDVVSLLTRADEAA